MKRCILKAATLVLCISVLVSTFAISLNASAETITLNDTNNTVTDGIYVEGKFLVDTGNIVTKGFPIQEGFLNGDFSEGMKNWGLRSSHVATAYKKLSDAFEITADGSLKFNGATRADGTGNSTYIGPATLSFTLPGVVKDDVIKVVYKTRNTTSIASHFGLTLYEVVNNNSISATGTQRVTANIYPTINTTEWVTRTSPELTVAAISTETGANPLFRIVFQSNTAAGGFEIDDIVIVKKNTDTEWVDVMTGDKYASNGYRTEGCYTYTVTNDKVTIIDVGTSTNGDILIPSVIDGYPVTSIGDYAFQDCTTLRTITIPDSITSIGVGAFNSCNELARVHITDLKAWCGIKFENYNSNPLYFAEKLYINGKLITEDLAIPDGTTKISSYAFSGFNGFTSVTFPSSVLTVGANAFSGCSGLEGVNISDLQAWCEIEFENGSANPLYYAENLYFKGNLVTGDLLIPNGTTKIGSYVFYHYTKLTGAIIPDSVISIDSYAFGACTNLTSIIIPDGVTSIGDYAFSSCTGLTSITIPDSVTSIGDSAFANCRKLVTVNFNAISCATMGSYSYPVFSGCSNLETVNIGNKVTKIPSYAFEDCAKIVDITIPHGVTSIGDCAFEDCVGLTSLTIPNSVTGIDEYAFDNCTKISDVWYFGSVEEKEKLLIEEYGNEFLTNATWHYVVDDLAQLTYTVDGTTLTISGEGILGNYSSSVRAPWYMDIKTEYGGYECFSEECDGIDYVTTAKYDVIISEGITSIGSYAFDGSVYVTHPFFPDYPEVMGYHVHELIRDADFTSVQIPASVTYIAPDAFVECDGMIIKGYSGTYAETYALENGYTFESLGKYVPKLSFKGASVTLQSSLAFNFKVDSALFTEGAYANPYVVFNMNGKEVKVDTYTVDGDKYVFTLFGISPDKMNDNIIATLYATFEGEEYTAVKEYSVAEYCYNMLAKYADNASLRTLIVDLLNYGAASQIYNNYNTENLANAKLTAEQSAWGSLDEEIRNVLNTKYETVDNPEIAWKGASLILLESVAIRIRFETQNIDGLTMNIVSADNEWNIDSTDFVKLGDSYYVIFDKLGADKMSEEIFISIMKDGEKVSNTVRYSIESYAYSMQNSADQNLANLVKAMMRYGNSAKNYK